MNKKVLLGITSAAVLGVVGASNTAYADAQTATHMDTDGSVSFYTKNKPGGGPFEGNLALAWVPSEFDFGSNKVEANNLPGTRTYNQVIDTSTGTQYLAVSDDRASDAKTNWTVKAKLDEFVDTADSGNTLANAVVSMNVGTVKKYNIDIANSDKNTVATPNPNEVGSLELLDTGLTAAFANPAENTTLALTAGGAEVTALAYSNNNASVDGTVGVAREISKVNLKVLDHQKVANKKFTSTVHWNLTAEPAL